MSNDPIIALLAKQSTAKLRAMQSDVQSQIQDLQLQAHWIGRAIADKQGSPPATPAGDSGTNGASPKRSANSQRRRVGGTSDALRAILQAEPGRVWQPAEIAEVAHAQGLRSSSAAIRVALRRMGDEHFLTRGPDGTGWQLASENGSSASEPPTDAPSVGLGGMDGATSWPPDDRSGASTAPNQSGVST